MISAGGHCGNEVGGHAEEILPGLDYGGDGITELRENVIIRRGSNEYECRKRY